jgi:hypothetical protein
MGASPATAFDLHPHVRVSFRHGIAEVDERDLDEVDRRRRTR